MITQKTRWTFVWSFLLGLGVLLTGCTLESWDPVGGPSAENAAWTSEVQGEGQLRVIYLDVGQGASQLLISPSGRTMLIDAGNNDKEEEMLHYLQAYGVSRLDLVIGTHPDADHIGGLDRVIDRLDIGEIYMPKIQSNTKTFESLLNSIRRKGLKVKTAKAGRELAWDEQVQVKMLAPVAETDDNNNMSVVMKVTYGKTSFLLTGDAEAESERAMLESGANLSADVLLVGHHGSKSSTTARFLNAVKPKYAVIQVGDNSYGHPTKTVLDRLAKQQVKVYRNDLHGTVEISSDGGGYQITTERPG